MEVYLIRHGQSQNNVIESALPGSPAAQGRRHQDPELTAKGERQAQCAAEFMARRGHLYPDEHQPERPVLDQLYCSAMVRALHTAQFIGGKVGVRPKVWVDLHEVGGIYLDQDGGKVGLPGLSRHQIQARFPETQLSEQIAEQGWWQGGQEEVYQAQRRAVDVARQLREMAGNGGRIGLVSHGDFLDGLLKALEDSQSGRGSYWEHRNTGITRLDFEPGGRMVLRYLNRVEHLPAELLARG